MICPKCKWMTYSCGTNLHGSSELSREAINLINTYIFIMKPLLYYRNQENQSWQNFHVATYGHLCTRLCCLWSYQQQVLSKKATRGGGINDQWKYHPTLILQPVIREQWYFCILWINIVTLPVCCPFLFAEYYIVVYNLSLTSFQSVHYNI